MRMKELSTILQYTPGYVSVKLKFGRFYMTNISHSAVDIGSGPYSGPHKDLKELLSDLKGHVMSQDIRFSTTLSTYGPDADALADVWLPGGAAWTLARRDVFYDVQCTLDETKFLVEIDATTFESCCRGPSSEVGNLYIQCVERVWDMKVCMERSANLNTSAKHKNISEAIVSSLHVL